MPPLPDANFVSWLAKTANATRQARSAELALWLARAAAQPALRRTAAFRAFLAADPFFEPEVASEGTAPEAALLAAVAPGK